MKKILQSKLLILLEKIISRLNTYYKKNPNLLIWFKYILKHHSNYLIKIPGMGERLAPLVLIFKKRAGNFNKIYHLKGKLDMILPIKEQNIKSISKPEISALYNAQVVNKDSKQT